MIAGARSGARELSLELSSARKRGTQRRCKGGPLQYATIDPNAVVNPTLLVEVTNESTGTYDRSEKLGFYFALTTVCEVLIVSHREPRITLYRRDGNGFRGTEHVGASATVSLESLGVDVPLRDAYESAS
jgi:Uma2 family endonuclease